MLLPLQISGCIILGVSIYLKVNKDGHSVRRWGHSVDVVSCGSFLLDLEENIS